MTIETNLLVGLVVISLVLFTMNSGPRPAQENLPTIGIIECGCSDYYNISCMDWLANPSRYNCVYEEEGDLCGICEKKLGSISAPSKQ